MKKNADIIENSAGIENTGRLCSVYCPNCRKVTDKISFNLLREAGTVEVLCPNCFRRTILEYNGKKVVVSHVDPMLEELVWEIAQKRKSEKA